MEICWYDLHGGIEPVSLAWQHNGLPTMLQPPKFSRISLHDTNHGKQFILLSLLPGNLISTLTQDLFRLPNGSTRTLFPDSVTITQNSAHARSTSIAADTQKLTHPSGGQDNIHVINSQAVTHKIRLVRCSSHAPGLSLNNPLESLSSRNKIL